jgi:hypothetical protein
MEPKFSRELAMLFTHGCFFVSPLEYKNLIDEFTKYDKESDLPKELKEQLEIARKREKETKNILTNTNENTAFVINDIINEILKERGIK